MLNFGSLFGSLAPAQDDPLMGGYYDPKAAMMSAIGGGLRGMGVGLASGKPGGWAQGLAIGSGEGLDEYKNNTVKRVAAARLMEEAEVKKQERARADEERKKRDEYISQFPPEVQMKMRSIPGYMEKYTEATDPAFKEPVEAKRYNVGGTLVDADGNVIYQGEQTGGMALTVDPATGQIVFQQGGNIKPLTETQSKDTVFATRAEGALKTFEPIATAMTSLKDKAASKVPVLGNYVKSSDYQKAEQAGREFLAAILRKDTGAAITPSEIDEYGTVYLPAPGDGPEVLAQKAASRQRAVAALRAGMPPQAILMSEAALRSGQSASPPAGTQPQRYRFNANTGELE